MEKRGQPFEPALLAERDLKAWVRQRQVEDGAAPATINRALSTSRRCWAWLLTQGRVRENPLLTVKAVAQDPPAPRKLDRSAVDALLRAAADEDNVILRRCNEALLALLIYAGLRSQEAADVQLRDLDLDGGTVTVRAGKAGKFGRVPLHSEKEPRLDQATKLLTWADDLETASPHALRHSLAYRLLEDGASLAVVQRIMRHSRGEQTLCYATPNDRDLKDLIDRSGGV